jgi:LysM repeat protein
MRVLFSLLFVLCAAGCSSPLAHFHEEQRQRELAFQEMRTEIGDLKHALQISHTEFQILQDRLSDQENLAKSALRSKSPNDQTQAQLASCERKLLVLEKNLEKLSNDLRSLSKHAEQTTQSLTSFKDKILDCQKELAHHKQKLEGINQLKTTLGQISQAVSARSSTSASSSYKVKPGDTLEQIAKRHHLSTAALKRLNNISQDKIFVGQELKISEDGD